MNVIIHRSDCCDAPIREGGAGHDVCTKCNFSCKKNGFYTKDELLLMRLQDLYNMPGATREEISQEAERRRENKIETYKKSCTQ